MTNQTSTRKQFLMALAQTDWALVNSNVVEFFSERRQWFIDAAQKFGMTDLMIQTAGNVCRVVVP